MMNARPFSKTLTLVLVMGLLLAVPGYSNGQTVGNLASGQLMEGSTDWEGSVAYGFEAPGAGVLTVVVRAADGSDVFLLVTDSDGQPLPNGRSDQDIGGDAGAEQFAVNLPRAGTYQVRVETYDNASHPFKVGVSWLPFPDLAVPADPDGTPGSATAIRIGQDTHTDALDGTSGDFWDWFVLRAERAGTLTIATRADDGDLILEAFEAGEFAEPMERSDQDLQGNGGNEAITLLVEVGDEFFFKISAFSEGASIPYRLQVGFIPSQE